MKKVIGKSFDEIMAYVAIAMGFMLAGSNIGGYFAAVKFGAVYAPEFAFMPEWTTSPVCMLVCGIVSMALSCVLIYFLIMDQKKD